MVSAQSSAPSFLFNSVLSARSVQTFTCVGHRLQTANRRRATTKTRAPTTTTTRALFVVVEETCASRSLVVAAVRPRRRDAPAIRRAIRPVFDVDGEDDGADLRVASASASSSDRPPTRWSSVCPAISRHVCCCCCFLTLVARTSRSSRPPSPSNRRRRGSRSRRQWLRRTATTRSADRRAKERRASRRTDGRSATSSSPCRAAVAVEGDTNHDPAVDTRRRTMASFTHHQPLVLRTFAALRRLLASSAVARRPFRIEAKVVETRAQPSERANAAATAAAASALCNS